MRTLSSTLTAAQKSSSARPHPLVEVFDKVGGITRLTWSRFYSGSEDDYFHAACMPADGSLIRLRVASGSKQLYRQRVTSPDSGSTYNSWTDWGVDAYAVAICAYGTKVWAFRIDATDGHLYRSDSTDSGASWGAWVDMGDVSGDATFRLAACAKSATEAIVLYADGTDIYRILLAGGSWGTALVYQEFTEKKEASDVAQTTITKPAGTSDGDLLIACVVTDGGTTISPPGGWTQIDSRSGYGAWWKKASSEPANYTFTWTGGNEQAYSFILRITGQHATSPINVSDGDAGTSDTPTCPGVTTTIGSTLVLRLFGAEEDDITVDGGYPSSHTGITVDRSSTGAGTCSGGAAYKAQGGVGPTGAANFTLTASVYWASLTIAIAPAVPPWSNSMNSITGVAVTYMGDWNIVITGTENTTTKPGVWTCLLGDGYGAAPGNWSSLKELMIAEAASNVTFKFPTLDMPDVFRAFFVEAYSGSEAYSRPYWTHSLATADFVDNLWREPVPFNLASDYGLAICYKSSYVWLTRPDGVWRASISAESVEITDSVLQIEAETNETSGRITIVLRNDDGRFANIGQSGDTYEAIRLGSEIKFSPGYHSSAEESSPEHSTGLAHWITGWEYTSHGGHAEFILHAVDGWGLLEEWKARRQFSWASGDKNIFQLLNFIFARAGLEFSSFGSSSAITAQYPTFTIYPSENGRATVLRLLTMVEDVLFFRGHYGYLKHPQTADSTDYTYGTDHAIHEGIYRQYVKQVNRAQAFGDSVFTEDWDWDEVELVWDKLAQAYDTNLDTTTKAHQRGDAMLREAAIRAISGHIIVPLNCGQELYDVIEITDSRAGLSSAKRRILGLNHHYVPAKGIYSLTAILGTV